MRDQKSDVDFKSSIAPQAAITATATGSSVDLLGYEAATVILNVGVITDGTHTPKLQESADNVTFTDVVAADLVGAFAAIASSTNQRVGYIGSQRYIQVVSTVSGASSGGYYSAAVLRGYPAQRPLA